MPVAAAVLDLALGVAGVVAAIVLPSALHHEPLGADACVRAALGVAILALLRRRTPIAA